MKRSEYLDIISISGQTKNLNKKLIRRAQNIREFKVIQYFKY